MLNTFPASSRGLRQVYLVLVLGLALLLAFSAGVAFSRSTSARAADTTPASVIGPMLQNGEWEVIDLSVATAENMPAWWPYHPPFFIRPINFFVTEAGPNGTNGWFTYRGPYAAQGYEIDEHTGTQIDCPPHFIPPPGVNAPFAADVGTMTCDKIPLSASMGPAVVVDVRSLLPAAEKGKSAHITRAWLENWEATHGRFQPGEVALFYGGYSDAYYKPFPEGDRLAWQPVVEKSQPGWQAPDPDAMDLMHERGVIHVGTDAPSMGWVEGGQPTHVAGLKYGMTWTEFNTNLGSLPERGAFYVMATYKVQDQQAGIGRAFAFKPKGANGVASSNQ
jgi:kynurenine formamidase